MSDAILVLNVGSSSIKFALFPGDSSPVRDALICSGKIENIGHVLHFVASDGAGALLAANCPGGTSHEDALAALLGWIEVRFSGYRLVAAGHRVVHGGRDYGGPVRIDAAVTQALRALIPLAPLHQPHHLAAIDALSRQHPALTQIACFDTAFHRTQPDLATAFALPRALAGEGIRRYGFHGLSYEYIADALPGIAGLETANARVVVAHLGSGASLCAMRDRRSVATTMGFTALDGLPMSRRCGNLDPGVVLYLMQQKGMTADEVSHLLYQESGLYGVSGGVSDDMRELLDSTHPAAREAVDLFAYRIGRELGSLAAALGGLDALVFTAGIGEHAAEIRRKVCEGAAWLGVELDDAANAADASRITRPGSRVSAWVIPTDEDLMIARHVYDMLRPGARS
ncbi:MAG: acetate/propionate family kinase [Bordetella sp.]|uniref:acetate/propionate family kinase n=1 Tax=Bordetella sp. TaxID=28081 RepID=UPI003F7C69BA